MGTSPASSESQKRIRESIKNCTNAIHIKDDIFVHGKGQLHDVYLRKVLSTLDEHGLTLRPDNSHLEKPKVKWLANIYSKNGVSPDQISAKLSAIGPNQSPT